MFRSTFLLLLSCFSVTFSFAQTQTLSPGANVSVLTCGSGDAVYSLFGHTAVRIYDPAIGLDMVYNYGAFDFDTPNFVAKFSKGDLQYFVTSDRFEDFLYSYQYEKRSVVEQTLNLNATQKQLLYDRLTETLVSDERFYTYKFIDRNCTTMVVDLLNDILGEKAIVKVIKTDVPYRDILYPYFDGHFYEQLGTSIIFGTKVDRPGNTVFLPIELWNSINMVSHSGGRLHQSHKTWLDFGDVTPAMSWWNNPYTYILLLILVVLAKSMRVTVIFFAVIGAIGAFFAIAGWYSYHGELATNYNALLLNPALLPLIWMLHRKNQLWIRRLAIFCLLCIAIYLVVMIDKIHLLIVLPLVITQIVLLGRLLLKSAKSAHTP